MCFHDLPKFSQPMVDVDHLKAPVLSTKTALTPAHLHTLLGS